MSITGLRVRGQPIPQDLEIRSRPDYIQAILGWSPKFVAGGGVRVAYIIQVLDERLICNNDITHFDQTIQNFLLFRLSKTLFSNTGDMIHLWCLRALEVMEDINIYNWDDAAMAVLYNFYGCNSSAKDEKHWWLQLFFGRYSKNLY